MGGNSGQKTESADTGAQAVFDVGLAHEQVANLCLPGLLIFSAAYEGRRREIENFGLTLDICDQRESPQNSLSVYGSIRLHDSAGMDV